MAVGPEQRFSKDHPCLICQGCDSDPRGQGVRCFGFLSDDGQWAHCTREEFAGSIQITLSSQTYAHRLNGPCKCGVTHGENPTTAIARPEPSRTPVDLYDYRDESGRVLFQVIRYDPKSFSQRRPDEKGGYINNLEGARRVLYRLPELRSSDLSYPIFVVEGEKDVEALVSLGKEFIATTNPGGAGHWRDEFSEHLATRTVVLLPDNDPEGKKHAFDVGKSLLRVGVSLKVLQLPTHDISDWVAAGGTAEQLWTLAAGATEMGSEENLSAALGIEVPAEKKLPFKTAHEIANSTPQEPRWIVKPWIAEGSVTELVGKAKLAGKTTFLSHLVKSVLNDTPFLEQTK